MKHTQGKWVIDGGESNKGDLFIWKAGEYYGGHAIATVHGEIQEGATANARRICQCVNNHDALLESCRALLAYLKELHQEEFDKCHYGDTTIEIERAEQAIKEAE